MIWSIVQRVRGVRLQRLQMCPVNAGVGDSWETDDPRIGYGDWDPWYPGDGTHLMESVAWWKSISPCHTLQAESAPLNPHRGKWLLDAFCQHLLYSWHKPRTGGEFIHGCCFALSCIWKLTLVSSEFQSRQKHNNWAVSQPQGEGIWEW